MNVLVTGGAGFISHHIVERLLETDHEVTVLDDLSSGDPNRIPDNATFIEGDIRDKNTVTDAVTNTDCIYHLAALASVPASVEDPRTAHTINVDGTLNILEAARTHDTRVVLASSAAIYGHPTYTPIDEAHPTEPTSPYGIDKLAADHYTRRYHDLYDLDTVAIRPFNVYGPGQTSDGYAGVVSTFIEQALAGNDLTVHGDGMQSRDFVYVDDIVNAMIAAGETEHVGQAFNIGSGAETTVRELAEAVRDVTDAAVDIIYTDPREGDIHQSVADITKARSQLGYEPTVDLREGLRRTVDWWVETQRP